MQKPVVATTNPSARRAGPRLPINHGEDQIALFRTATAAAGHVSMFLDGPKCNESCHVC
jgi:hypothetical protein